MTFSVLYSAQFSPVAQSCLTLCDPMDCILPGSSVHESFQARVLEWVAISFSDKDWLFTLFLLAVGFPWAQLVKNPPAMRWINLGSIPGLGRSPGEGKGYPLQYSGLENSVHRVAKSQT